MILKSLTHNPIFSRPLVIVAFIGDGIQTKDIGQICDAYLRMVSGIDNAIGRFITALEARVWQIIRSVFIQPIMDSIWGIEDSRSKWSHYEESLRGSHDCIGSQE